MVVFRGLDGGEETHLLLSRVFGELEDHAMTRDRADRHPELLDIFYDGSKGEIYEVDGKLLGAWLPWHIDLIYIDRMNHGGILRAIELPRGGGGQTGFIDRINAYDRLPDELKARIEGLNVVYRAHFDASIQQFKSNRARTIHPLVYRQPNTGRKVLNVSPWFAESSEGAENEEGDAILKAAIEHSIRPDLAYFHDWQVEDMVLWDNWRMMHSARGVAADDRRVMKRTTIAGDYELGRVEGGVPFPDALRISV